MLNIHIQSDIAPAAFEALLLTYKRVFGTPGESQVRGPKVTTIAKGPNETALEAKRGKGIKSPLKGEERERYCATLLAGLAGGMDLSALTESPYDGSPVGEASTLGGESFDFTELDPADLE